MISACAHTCVFITWQRGGGVCASKALCVEIGLQGKTENTLALTTERTLALTSPTSKVIKLQTCVRRDKEIVAQACIKSTISLFQRPFLLMTAQY